MTDFDWLVIGSGFGGSVSALRLAQKGHRVGVLECGRRFADHELPKSTWDLRRYWWAPRLGLKGIFRMTIFRDVAIASGSGVGGGSLGYANTLYRAPARFYEDPQWAELNDWQVELAPHYAEAERMLGVTTYDEDDPADDYLREYAEATGVGETYAKTRVGVFLGAPGKTVPDPFFGGEGPDRTGCMRCGRCMVGCPHGAKNTLVKNYLWFAERAGARIMPERTVTDIKPLPGGGYAVTSERSGAWMRKQRRTQTAKGVVVAAGALGTNRLLAACKLHGSLPRISDRLGELVRTNSEAILAVTLPKDTSEDVIRRVAITGSIYPDPHTHIETVVYGDAGDAMSGIFTLLTGDGTTLTRPLKLVGAAARHPVRLARSMNPRGWSRRTIIVLVMQSLDNAIALRARKTRRGVRLTTEQDPERPNPTFIPVANAFTEWLAKRTGGIAQSSIMEAAANIPSTAHILGGAVIGASPASGVVDSDLRVFGYENLLVCDGAAIPANVGVNPSLTITALAEHAMSRVA
ncbi:GMC family oxidoreductase [Solirubrobacter sp. CPCC 204708]|uniref:Cholesterol oxidase n=1 Tax=Solirubrobacter deserti TaxID=2282478 RepID=A0ABT4RK86_9ACTN|nr:GMC family oxidoreductase [Solirubrobacter deserti]MBE2319761.1 GMC family oxidoreductase [Solirubrobacter deserti]MDA0138756.1 GMC family oxidoreductase [Solirubrobacter deserti]